MGRFAPPEASKRKSAVDYLNRPLGLLSFCIPTNGKKIDATILLVKSIISQNEEVEIIIAGNTEGLPQMRGVRPICMKEESLTGQASKLRNVAASVASGDTIVFCDDDILLGKEWLKETKKYSLSHPWNVLSNPVLNIDGTRHWDRATIFPEHQLVPYDTIDSTHNLYQPGAFFLVRKEISQEVRWDESTRSYSDRNGGSKIPEDVQYSFDLQLLGYQFSFNQNSPVWHNDHKYTYLKSKNRIEVAKSHVVGSPDYIERIRSLYSVVL